MKKSRPGSIDTLTNAICRWSSICLTFAQDLKCLSLNHDSKKYGAKVLTGKTLWVDLWRNTAYRETIGEIVFKTLLEPAGISVMLERKSESVHINVPSHRLREATAIMLTYSKKQLSKSIANYHRRHTIVMNKINNTNEHLKIYLQEPIIQPPPTAEELEYILRSDP